MTATNPNATLWVLGAADPEMVAVEALLRAVGAPVEYATKAGRRVTAETAYQADPPHLVDSTLAIAALLSGETAADPSTYGTVYRVECSWHPDCSLKQAAQLGQSEVVVIDHHRPGDPGYGRPPAEFLAGSSIGQVIAHLARLGLLTWERLPWMVAGVPGALVAPYTAPGADDPDWWVYVAPDVIARVPHDLVLTAAADHCLGAACRGKCPGVGLVALLQWRAESRAAFQGRSVESVLADVEHAADALRFAPEVSLRGGVSPKLLATSTEVHDWYAFVVRDLRGREIPELPEAACLLGVAYLATPAVRAGERVKVVLGCASPDQVAAFLRGEGPAAELVDRYGFPERGMAGGYLAAPGGEP